MFDCDNYYDESRLFGNTHPTEEEMRKEVVRSKDTLKKGENLGKYDTYIKNDSVVVDFKAHPRAALWFNSWLKNNIDSFYMHCAGYNSRPDLDVRDHGGSVNGKRTDICQTWVEEDSELNYLLNKAKTKLGYKTTLEDEMVVKMLLNKIDEQKEELNGNTNYICQLIHDLNEARNSKIKEVIVEKPIYCKGNCQRKGITERIGRMEFWRCEDCGREWSEVESEW